MESTQTRKVLGRELNEATDLDFPGLAKDLEVLPPSYIEPSQVDYLRSSGILFADQLEQADIDVECHVAIGVPHGHLHLVGSSLLQESYTRFINRMNGTYAH